MQNYTTIEYVGYFRYPGPQPEGLTLENFFEPNPVTVIFTPCRHKQPVNIRVKAETWYYCKRCRCHRIIARRTALEKSYSSEHT